MDTDLITITGSSDKTNGDVQFSRNAIAMIELEIGSGYADCRVTLVSGDVVWAGKYALQAAGVVW